MEIHLRTMGTVMRIAACRTTREASSVWSSAGLSPRGKASRQGDVDDQEDMGEELEGEGDAEDDLLLQVKLLLLADVHGAKERLVGGEESCEEREGQEGPFKETVFLEKSDARRVWKKNRGKSKDD